MRVTFALPPDAESTALDVPDTNACDRAASSPERVASRRLLT
jgi:hypothetical protein